ncbi:MAG: hypothetical protein AAGG56_12045 [Pseudomonadota bacterium]
MEARYVMENYAIGDLVVLTAGSMRMAVEAVDGDTIACVWCHEGRIGRDKFNSKLLKKWEFREEERGASRADGNRGGGRGDREQRRNRNEGGGNDRPPRGKPGWDGKPREKKFFRKEA